MAAKIEHGPHGFEIGGCKESLGHAVFEEMFGHYCAMQAMGHGVGLADAFGRAAREAIEVPYCEFGSHSLEKDYFP